MPRLRPLQLPLLILPLCWLISCSQQPAPSSNQPATETVPKAAAAPAETAALPATAEDAATGDTAPATTSAAHTDHVAKHGGTFFMALDNKHHLEGVLDPPGVFHVYVYDDHTRPLRAAELGMARAQVIWGEQDGASEIDLMPSPDGTFLEAGAPGPMQFPLTLVLLVHFPGAAATARPELFTFPFSHYSHPPTAAHTHAEGH